MSGFSSDWLKLREPADLAARNRTVLAAVGRAFHERTELAIADLACGTGSTLRAVALELPPSTQHWTLVDHDQQLLAAGRLRLSEWADHAEHLDDRLVIGKAAKRIEVTFIQASLTADLGCLRDHPTDLVTASAFFDLVSAEWIAAFVKTLAARRLPLYAALNYDGVEAWTPGHAAWTEIHQAFTQHQRREKGFGLSAGPDAGRVLGERLQAEGFGSPVIGNSPWQLSATDAALMAQLSEGIARAAVEQRPALASRARAWRAAIEEGARRGEARATIGHVDVWSGLN